MLYLSKYHPMHEHQSVQQNQADKKYEMSLDHEQDEQRLTMRRQ